MENIYAHRNFIFIGYYYIFLLVVKTSVLDIKLSLSNKTTYFIRKWFVQEDIQIRQTVDTSVRVQTCPDIITVITLNTTFQVLTAIVESDFFTNLYITKLNYPIYSRII